MKEVWLCLVMIGFTDIAEAGFVFTLLKMTTQKTTQLQLNCDIFLPFTLTDAVNCGSALLLPRKCKVNFALTLPQLTVLHFQSAEIHTQG